MNARHLGELNTTRFFCRGCGMSPEPPDGEACPTCLKDHLADPIDDAAFAVYVLIAGVVIAVLIGVAAIFTGT